ncbi:MAG: MarR family transcriptional regulator [Patulibacter sp.]|nr:MarR family transcriptional regulator [Patulibacter sp.]
MKNDAPHDQIATQALTQALIGFASIRRDLRRRAGYGNIPGGLPALGAVRRIGPARVSDIACELQVDLSVASRQLQALETEGYVDRSPDPTDRRSSVVSLSAAGEEKLRGIHELVDAALDEALSDWRPEEIKALVDGLERLRSDLADPADPGSAAPKEQSA